MASLVISYVRYVYFYDRFVNRSYRSYDIGRTTDVVSYVRPTFVNSTQGFLVVSRLYILLKTVVLSGSTHEAYDTERKDPAAYKEKGGSFCLY